MIYYNEIDPLCCQWLANLMDADLIPRGDIDSRSIRDVQPQEVSHYQQCHFFCGIAGWPLALGLAGWPAERPIWTGSAPCQPYSSAGKRQGEADERDLWPEFFRLLRACRPPIVFGEQVASPDVVGTELEAAFVAAVQQGEADRANLLAERIAKRCGDGETPETLGRRWIDRICADLEGEDYAFRFDVLGAHSAGADHIRQRVFWLANARHAEQRRQDVCGSGGENEGVRVEKTVPPRGRREAFGMADSSGERPGSDPFGRGDCPSEGERRLVESGGCGSAGGLGNADGSGSLPGRTALPANGYRGSALPNGGFGGLGNAEGAGRSRRTELPGVSGEEAAVPRDDGRQRATFERTSAEPVAAVFCTDGKCRRFESGAFPLAHAIPTRNRDPRMGPLLARLGELGHSAADSRRILREARANRVGRLKGYGNAIVSQVAATFIRAFLEAENVENS